MMIKVFLVLPMLLMLLVPVTILAQPTFMNQTRYYPIYVDSTCFFHGLPLGCVDDSGFYFHDKETDKLVKPLPYIAGIPVCHDPLYIAGVLGKTCYDEADDPTDPITPLPERVSCTDGRTCPPCPEGVEASWCQDEDERQDTDDCLRPDGSERFPCREDRDRDEDDSVLGPEIIDEDDTPTPPEGPQGETQARSDDDDDGDDDDNTENNEDESSPSLPY
jgi:hypothetical protein